MFDTLMIRYRDVEHEKVTTDSESSAALTQSGEGGEEDVAVVVVGYRPVAATGSDPGDVRLFDSSEGS